MTLRVSELVLQQPAVSSRISLTNDVSQLVLVLVVDSVIYPCKSRRSRSPCNVATIGG